MSGKIIIENIQEHDLQIKYKSINQQKFKSIIDTIEVQKKMIYEYNKILKLEQDEYINKELKICLDKKYTKKYINITFVKFKNLMNIINTQTKIIEYSCEFLKCKLKEKNLKCKLKEKNLIDVDKGKKEDFNIESELIKFAIKESYCSITEQEEINKVIEISKMYYNIDEIRRKDKNCTLGRFETNN